MFRRMTFTALLAAGTLTGLALTPAAATAAPPGYPYPYPVQYPTQYPWGGGRDRDRHDHDHDHGRARFEVQYRHRGHWDTYATFRDRDDAVRAARRLQYQGHVVRIDRD